LGCASRRDDRFQLRLEISERLVVAITVIIGSTVEHRDVSVPDDYIISAVGDGAASSALRAAEKIMEKQRSAYAIRI
jgi:hypothetical protein